jgi:flagellar protein FliO/FliZ
MSFFGGMPFPVQFFLAFVVVLGLIGATAWAVRRFGAGRLGSVGTRGRQPRLAVVDYASVDARRRLLLIRRDNVEHLVMIGGPTDVVVESNIVRASPAQREIPIPSRPPAIAEAPSRPIALPDSAANGSWAIPEPAPAATAPRAPRPELPQAEPVVFPLQSPPETQPRLQRETPLVAPADELAAKPAAPPRSRPQGSPRPLSPEPRPVSPNEPRLEARQEPRISLAQPLSAEPASATDQNLAEMAHRLEAALRKPTAKVERSPAPEPRAVPMPRAAMPAEQTAAPEPTAPTPPAASSPAPVQLPQRPSRVPEIKPQRADAKQPGAGKTLYDSLEQEMASLLGRSTAKN